jgi:hypothetical protein
MSADPKDANQSRAFGRRGLPLQGRVERAARAPTTLRDFSRVDTASGLH